MKLTFHANHMNFQQYSTIVEKKFLCHATGRQNKYIYFLSAIIHSSYHSPLARVHYISLYMQFVAHGDLQFLSAL